jgi:hypothetical protein
MQLLYLAVPSAAQTIRRYLLVVMLISIRENEGDNRIGLDPHPARSLAWVGAKVTVLLLLYTIRNKPLVTSTEARSLTDEEFLPPKANPNRVIPRLDIDSAIKCDVFEVD